MDNYSKIAVITLLLLCSIKMSAQYATFEYQTELCDCKAKFDSTKYSIKQLQNTLELYSGRAAYIAIGPFMLFKASSDFLLDSLEREGTQRLKYLNRHDIVNDKFWQGVRARVVKYINSTCELRRVTILAQNDPKELLNYKLVDDNCKYFRDALIAGGDELLKAWPVLNEIQKKKNVRPAWVQHQFEEKYNSPEKLEYAREEVFMYGWWNFANNLLPHIHEKGLEENFERLLKDVQCDCDEP